MGNGDVKSTWLVNVYKSVFYCWFFFSPLPSASETNCFSIVIKNEKPVKFLGFYLVVTGYVEAQI